MTEPDSQSPALDEIAARLAELAALLTAGHSSAPNLRELDEWSTAEELAAWLKIPKQTLYGWRHDGIGPIANRVGRHLRYRKPNVEVWLKEGAGIEGGESA